MSDIASIQASLFASIAKIAEDLQSSAQNELGEFFDDYVSMVCW